jgi:putative ABC transport system permease protein
MGTIRYKIWYDLWKNKGRTLQVVMIVAMGAFAIGLIISTRMLLIPIMHDLWRDATPAMITLWTNPSVDDETIEVLRRINGLEDVEGYTFVSIEWRPSSDDAWSPAFLIVRDDYESQRYTTLGLLSGTWPQGKTFAVSQGIDVVYGIEQGARVHLRVNEREHVVEIGGVVYDPVTQPPSFGGPVQFFTTRERLGYLTGDRGFNRILAGAPRYDEAVLTDLATQMQDKLEKQGVDSGGAAPSSTNPGARIADPEVHFFAPFMDTIFFIMGLMSILALILALFLVYNTINAIVSQQVDQIGIMKAIGASRGQILRLYLITVLAYGGLALVIAVPLGAIGGWGLNLFLLNTFNAEPGPFTVAPLAIGAQVALALLAPLLASLIPILTGARITVREAISTYGLSAKASLLDRLLARIKGLPRQFMLTVSNTFRHRGRVALTQITLVLSGLVFMMVMSVRDSAAYTFGDILFGINNFDVFLGFQDPERIDRVEELTLAHPDVRAVEMWHADGPRIRRADQPESEDDPLANLTGRPLPTALYVPQMRAGRWLLPEDVAAVVLNQKLAEEIGVGVGDWVVFDHGVKGETTWQVVGLLFDPTDSSSAHVPRDVLLKELGSPGRARSIVIQTVRGDPAGEQAAAKSLRAYYEEYHLDVSPSLADTASEITAQVLGQFGFIISLLAIMAVVIGLVGSIALSGVLSLNVLERGREIGVLRAIGAPSLAIARLFVGEGLILGWLSWVIALPLSIPAGRLMAAGLSTIAPVEIVYKYTPMGPLYWLGIITVLAFVASLLPARGALRITVRESLAYQ